MEDDTGSMKISPELQITSAGHRESERQPRRFGFGGFWRCVMQLQ